MPFGMVQGIDIPGKTGCMARAEHDMSEQVGKQMGVMSDV